MALLLKNGNPLKKLIYHAREILFDNSDTSLEATDVQSALVEIDGIKVGKPNYSEIEYLVNSATDSSYSYTATEECYINVFGRSTGSVHCYIQILINNATIGAISIPSNSNYIQSNKMFYLNKNDKIDVTIISGQIRTVQKISLK